MAKYQPLKTSVQSGDVVRFEDESDDEPIGDTLSTGQRWLFYLHNNTAAKVMVASVFLLLTLILLLQLSAVIVMATKNASLPKNTTDTILYLRDFADQQTQATQDMANSIAYLRNFADQETVQLNNNTNAMTLVRKISEASTEKLTNIVSTLTSLKSTSTSTARVVDDMLIVVEELLAIQNASALFNSLTPVSCKDILKVLPDSPTGYYYVNSHNIYCNMGELCGTGGGWTRLAYLDMTDSTVNCPTGFRLYTSGDVRACGRPSGGASCVSAKFPSNGISYSQICGRVVGYQYASTDAVDAQYGDSSQYNNLNSYYVDGVSITRGSPRQHVWTLISGFSDTYSHTVNCPCNSPAGVAPQQFIGSNYFCESGNHANGWSHKLYTDDPLWDGQGCGPQEGGCCSAPGLPWFHRDYNNITTTDFIELRDCGDQPTNDEDCPVSFYEIYVK